MSLDCLSFIGLEICILPSVRKIERRHKGFYPLFLNLSTAPWYAMCQIIFGLWIQIFLEVSAQQVKSVTGSTPEIMPVIDRGFFS